MKKVCNALVLTLGVLGAFHGMAAGPDEHGIYASGGKLYTSATMTEEVTCGTLARLKAGTMNYWYEGCEACAQGEYCKVTSYTEQGECNTTNASYFKNVKGACTAIDPSDIKRAEIEGLGKVTYSDKTMNWWSAKTWCEALGLRLIDREKMATYFDALYAESGKRYIWTITTVGSAVGDYTCRAYNANAANDSTNYYSRTKPFGVFCL